MGELSIRDEYISSLEIRENIHKKPKITIIGACETQVPWGSSLDVANMFINSGCVAVLGSYFEVDGPYTQRFILNILYNLLQFHKQNFPRIKWSDFLLDVFRKSYILDSFISLKNYLKNKKIMINIDELMEEFYEYCKVKSINQIEMCEDKNEIILAILKNKGSEYENAYNFLLNENRILHQSLFYASLGSPEHVFLE